MSVVTLSSLKYVSAEALAKILLASSSSSVSGEGKGNGGKEGTGNGEERKIAVVDVRDDDHLGGHIRGSLHFPSQALDATMPTLLRKLADAETVVFHCALSQQRGPRAALRYLRERASSFSSSGTSSAASTGVENAENGEKDGGNGENGEKKQTVLVLERGFVGWQELYGADERLTEGYRRDVWEGGY